MARTGKVIVTVADAMSRETDAEVR